MANEVETKKYLSLENAARLWDEAAKIYVAKEEGKGLSTNDFTDEDKAKLDSLEKMDPLTNAEIDIITGSASTIDTLKDLILLGGDIRIDADMTADDVLVFKHDTVLNLCGHTLRSGEDVMLVVADARLTIQNGTFVGTKTIGLAQRGGEIVIKDGVFDSGDVAFAAVGVGSKITMDGGDVTCVEGGLGAYDGSAVEMNGGRITGTDNFPIFTNGTDGRGGNTIVMNGGELIGKIKSANYEACGVYVANNDTFIMNGGTIRAENGCGLLMRGGTVVINDGEITATGNGGTGWVGDNKRKMSESAVIFDKIAAYPGSGGMNLTINGGRFKGVAHSLEVLSDVAEPNVTINGGEFIPAYN